MAIALEVAVAWNMEHVMIPLNAVKDGIFSINECIIYLEEERHVKV